MISFKQYLEETEEVENMRSTLERVPAAHRKLVQGYRFNLQAGNTLKGDRKHVGYVDEKPKKIALAAPWLYPREFTFLHELGHRVYEKLTPELKSRWEKLAKQKPQEGGAEEAFCMFYANHYSQHKLVKFDSSEMSRFIKDLPDAF